MAEWAWSGWALSFQAANRQDESSSPHPTRELSRQEADPPDYSRRPDNAKKVNELVWPLFPTPTISCLQVTGYEPYNNTMYYTVLVGMGGGFQWTILKSYDEFASLHKMLVDYYGVEKSLLPHQKVFGAHRPDSIKEMRRRLDGYLASVLKHFTLPPPHLLQFLEYRFCDILSITQTLSALFYDRGEEYIETNSMVAFSPLQFHCICQRLVLPIESEQQSVKQEFGHLLDFLQQLRKVKVCPPTRQLFTLAPSVKLKFDLSVLKSIHTLVLQNINLELIEGFGNIPQCLTVLATHNGLNAIRDILKHTSLGVATDGQHVNWPCLKVIDFSHNEVTAIDSSLELAPNLEEMNLSNNLIRDIDNILDLPHLRILDLSNNKLESLADLHCRLGNITTLCLAKNALKSLKGLEKCYSIVCLDIQFNRLNKINDLAPLSSLPLLEQLMIKGNPFTEAPFYRQKVFSLLLNTAAQVSLDGKPATGDELKVSQSISERDSKQHSQKLKRAVSREAKIKGEDEEVSPVGRQDGKQSKDKPNFAGARKNIEEMRKEGGENWLSLLNQQQEQGSPMVIHKKQKTKKRTKKKQKTLLNTSSSGGDMDSSAEYPNRSATRSHGPSSGLPSPHLIQLMGTRHCSSTPWSCSTSVMDYKGTFPSLSLQEIDDLLMTNTLEPCVIMVDIGLGRITEDFAISGTAGKSRNTRDLTFLRGVRVHEGHSLAIAIELSTIVTSSSWVIYSLKDYPSLADMYLLLSRKLKSVGDIPVPSPVLLSKQMSVPESDDIESGPEEEEEPDSTTSHLQVEEEGLKKSNKMEVKGNVELVKKGEDKMKSEEPIEQNKEPTEKAKDPIGNKIQVFKGSKPDLGNEIFHRFLMKKVVRDSSEVLLYVLWCGLCLPSTSPFQVEGTVVISNDCLYLLEVKGYQDWNGETLPLLPLTSTKLDRISRVTITGMFNFNLYFEVHQGSPITGFMVFPSNSEQCQILVHQIKAALDASNLDYSTMDVIEAKNSKKTSGILFISPDHYSSNRLKEWLSHDRTNVRLANFVSTQMDRKAVGMYEVELQQSCKELAKSFDIEQYLTVMLVDQNSPCGLHTLVLVVTSTELFLYKEAFITGPGLRFTPLKHLFPPLSILHHEKISSVKRIVVCDVPQTVHSPSDMMYQFSIEFAPNSEVPWYLCTRDKECLSQVLTYVQKQWNMLLTNSSTLVTATSSPLSYFTNLPQLVTHSLKKDGSHKAGVPRLIKSKMLLQFDSLPHWNKLEVFKEHVSQANYLKHDETVVTSCLVLCVPSLEKKLEVEVCILISNYAVYLLSDIDGIRQWLDAGGTSSFSRMSLLNPDSEYPLQCFYRMWLSDLQKVEVNHLSLSLCLYETRPSVTIEILTCSAPATASLLTALVAKINIVDHKQAEKEGKILQDFVDITDDPFGDEDDETEDPSPPSPSLSRPSVEMIVSSNKDLTALKLHLVESQPEVARGSSVRKCSESMQIICSQIMLLAENIRVRDTMLCHYRPHLLLVTNFGLFLCSNTSLPNNTPCLSLNTPTNINVKKRLKIDDILLVEITSDPAYHVPQILINIKPSEKKEGRAQLCLFPMSLIQCYVFVNQLGLLWAERTGQALQIKCF